MRAPDIPGRLYDDLVAMWPFVSPPDHYAEEVETFRRRFQQHGVPDGAEVLHLGSGGGSIDWHLKRHYRVTGVDISPAMRTHAGTVNPEVEYLPGDIRTVRLGRRFPAVLLHDAIAYMTTLEDLRSAYATAAAHLAPGGVLVSLPEELRGLFRSDHVDVETTTRGDLTVTTLEHNYDPDPDDTWFEKTFVFIIREGGSRRVEVDTQRVGIWELEEFLAAIRAAGLEPAVEPWELSDWEPGHEHPLITAVAAT